MKRRRQPEHRAGGTPYAKTTPWTQAIALAGERRILATLTNPRTYASLKSKYQRTGVPAHVLLPLLIERLEFGDLRKGRVIPNDFPVEMVESLTELMHRRRRVADAVGALLQTILEEFEAMQKRRAGS